MGTVLESHHVTKLWGNTDSIDSSLIPITAHVDSSSGYGTFSTQVIAELQRRNYNVEVRSPAWNENGAPLPKSVKSALTTKPLSHPWEFVIYPCVLQPAGFTIGKQRIAYFTMWESTRLSNRIQPSLNQAVATMNRCCVVMTPNAWNATIFSACGVDTPIRLVPLGTDISCFPVIPNLTTRPPLTFGTAARVYMGGVRKGFDRVIAAFRRAFPREADVRLRVKCFPDDPPIDTGGDRRIDVIRDFLQTSQLNAWYSSLNAFVSGSASEGWGRHQQEAMCCGRPVIGINFGGVCEFFNEENGYAVPWTLEPGEGIYQTMGHYAKPTIDGLALGMRLAYEDRATLARKSELASVSARRFTITHSVDCILAVLREFKLIE